MGDAETEPVTGASPSKRSGHRRGLHWVILVFNSLVALVCFGAAALLVVGQQLLTDTKKSAAIEEPTTVARTAPAGTSDASVVGDDTPPSAEGPTTTEAFPIADPQAQNFLITGSDNRACPDANSANPVPERDTLGERSDTIMVMRVDPSTSRAAVLSFPRDLWVTIAGSNGKNRINAAYVLNDPQKLIDTINHNFGIVVQHSIQVDFCAFKTLVDAVGGVSVYFQYPARDTHTGLDVNVTDACYTLRGDEALAYVRSRHYKYLNPDTGKYTEDPASDYGRISRQQDFLRRALAKILSQGFDLSVARSLIDVAQKYIVVDANLTIGKELEFAGVLKNLDPQDIQTYQIEGTGTVVGGAAVIKPRLDGDNMKAILAIFRGEAQLATAPEQVFESTTTSVPRTTTTTEPPTTTAPTTTRASSATATSTTTKSASTTTTTSPPTTTTSPATTTTSSLPESGATEITKGIFPPKDKTCD